MSRYQVTPNMLIVPPREPSMRNRTPEPAARRPPPAARAAVPALACRGLPRPSRPSRPAELLLYMAVAPEEKVTAVTLEHLERLLPTHQPTH